MKEKINGLVEKLSGAFRKLKRPDRKTVLIAGGACGALALIITVGVLIGKANRPEVGMADAKVTLGDYKGMTVTADASSVSDEEINTYIESLVTYYNTYGENDRTTVRTGDTIYATLLIYDSNNEAVESNTGTVFIEVGSGRPYAGLDSILTGASAGDVVQGEVVLGDGSTGLATISISYIVAEEITVSGMTDEQAGLLMDIGDMEGERSVAGLKSAVESLLYEYSEDAYRSSVYNSICDQLLETCRVDVFPNAELSDRYYRQMESLETMCTTYYGMSLNEYYTAIGTTEKEYKAALVEELKTVISEELYLLAIGDAEDIHYDEDDFQDWVGDIVSTYGYGSAEDFYEDYGEEYVKNAYRIELVVDWLIDNIEITENVD